MRVTTNLSVVMVTAHRLDAAGHQRFSGALNEPGARPAVKTTVPYALILMGDWCVPIADNHTIENPGAYQTLMTASRGDDEANSKKKNPPTGMFYPLTEARLMGDTFSSS